MNVTHPNLAQVVAELSDRTDHVDTLLRGDDAAEQRPPDDRESRALTHGADATVHFASEDVSDESPESSEANQVDVRWFGGVSDNGDDAESMYFFEWLADETAGGDDDDDAIDPIDQQQDAPLAADAGEAAEPVADAPPQSDTERPESTLSGVSDAPSGQADSMAVNEPPPAVPPASVPPSPTAQHNLRSTRPPIQPFATLPDDAPRAEASLELQIGQRWMAWIGATTVLAALAILTKLALDESWFGPFSRAACMAMALALAGSLLVAGQMALRRDCLTAAGGLSAAAVLVFSATTLAAHHLFGVTSVESTLLAYSGVMLLGLLLARRVGGAFLTTLVIGLTYAPLIAGLGITVDPVLRGVYLSIGLIAHLTALAWSPARTNWPRYLLVGLHTAAAWPLIDTAVGAPFASLGFAAVWWLAMLLHAIWVARRERLALGNPAIVMTATALLALFGYATLVAPGELTTVEFGMLVLGFSAILVVVALLMDRGRALRGANESAGSLLAASMWMQVGMLIVVATGLLVRGPAQTVTWILLGLAGVEFGRRLHSRGLTAYGLLLGAVAILRIIAIDGGADVVGRDVWIGGGVTITTWTVLALSAIVATQLAAVRYRCSEIAVSRAAPVSLGALSVVGWMALCVVQADGPAVTAGWLIACAVLLAFEQVGGRLRYLETALGVLVLTAGHWSLDQLWRAVGVMHAAAADTTPIWNTATVLALAIATTGLWAGRLLRARVCSAEERSKHERWQGPDGPWQAALAGGAVFLLFALHQDVRRMLLALGRDGASAWSSEYVVGLAQTGLWAFGALAIGALALLLGRRERNGLRDTPKLLARLAWTIASVCALKWLLIDCLFWGAADDVWLRPGVAPLWNLQMATGVIVAGVIFALYVGLRTAARVAVRVPDNGYKPTSLKVAAWIPVAASVMLLGGFAIEIERLARSLDAAAPIGERSLWWTLLWAGGGALMLTCGRFPGWKRLFDGGWALLAIATIVWLVFDTLICHVVYGVTPWAPVFNPQFVVGAALVAFLLSAVRVSRVLHERQMTDSDFVREARVFAIAAIAAIGLWLGTLEIDRFFDARATAGEFAMARHTALSTFWGFYGVLLVAAGFLRAAAAYRVAGLALLTVALGKVLLIDLSELAYVYRALSLLAVGLLLVGTSLAYARLAARTRRATPRRR